MTLESLLLAFSFENATLGQTAWWLLAVLALVLLNGFFVAAEFAIVKVRGSQLETLANEGQEKADFVLKMTEQKMDSYLSACQLGITIASLALGWIGEPSLARLIELVTHPLVGALPQALIHTTAFVIAFGIVTALHIVVGEQVPKVWAIRKALPVSMWVARPLHFFYKLFALPIRLLNTSASWILRRTLGIDTTAGGEEHAHSSEELRLLVEESSTSEVTDTERSIMMNTLKLSERQVRHIMIPRTDVISLEKKKSFQENLDVALQSEHSRFPLIEGHLDNTLGVMLMKDLVRAKLAGREGSLEKLAKPPLTVPEMMSLDNMLQRFLKPGSTHLAIVVDEHGSTVGIVCLEDVLEELVGEIRDEFDLPEDEKRFEELGPDEFLVHGGLALHELGNYCDLNLEAAEVSTVAGYVTQEMGHLPEVGETTRIRDYEVRVETTNGLRIQWLHFKRLPKEETKLSEEAPAGESPA